MMTMQRGDKILLSARGLKSYRLPRPIYAPALA
jgi:hypothetical protein